MKICMRASAAPSSSRKKNKLLHFSRRNVPKSCSTFFNDQYVPKFYHIYEPICVCLYHFQVKLLPPKYFKIQNEAYTIFSSNEFEERLALQHETVFNISQHNSDIQFNTNIIHSHYNHFCESLILQVFRVERL